jgi:hypothetical protein
MAPRRIVLRIVISLLSHRSKLMPGACSAPSAWPPLRLWWRPCRSETSPRPGNSRAAQEGGHIGWR